MTSQVAIFHVCDKTGTPASYVFNCVWPDCDFTDFICLLILHTAWVILMLWNKDSTGAALEQNIYDVG